MHTHGKRGSLGGCGQRTNASKSGRCDDGVRAAAVVSAQQGLTWKEEEVRANGGCVRLGFQVSNIRLCSPCHFDPPQTTDIRSTVCPRHRWHRNRTAPLEVVVVPARQCPRWPRCSSAAQRPNPSWNIAYSFRHLHLPQMFFGGGVATLPNQEMWPWLSRAQSRYIRYHAHPFGVGQVVLT